MSSEAPTVVVPYTDPSYPASSIRSMSAFYARAHSTTRSPSSYSYSSTARYSLSCLSWSSGPFALTADNQPWNDPPCQ